jgi:hypothetical protein
MVFRVTLCRGDFFLVAGGHVFHSFFRAQLSRSILHNSGPETSDGSNKWIYSDFKRIMLLQISIYKVKNVNTI